MLKDRMVCVKLKRFNAEQKPWCYVGKVEAFNDAWIVLVGRGIMVTRTEKSGVQIDEKSSAVMIPRDNIDRIRILPDSYDIKNMRVTTQGQQLRLVVDGAFDVYIGEMGEG
jgi:hypothetical protein